MARRKNETNRVDLSAFDHAGARIIDNPLTTEVEDSYLEYAYSVIHSRALPGRPRRSEAGASPHPLVDVRAGPPPRPAVREIGPRRRRRDGQVPPAR